MRALKIAAALLPVALLAAGFAIGWHLVTKVPYWLTGLAAGGAAGAFVTAWFTRAKPEPLPVLKPAETVFFVRRPPGAGFVAFADARELHRDAVKHHGRPS